ncbi:methanogenesis marker 5 protein [Candidatus Methanosphaera massiliense]|uniref:methanogenesis marker 5 protein n=1 Tax=Methanosphaera TaxID=2316 RepID=UPI00237FE53E|nr:methanogenesis marker 5 protein [Candidatus Methanosphaera massiliense]MDD6285367.1 methanogenesis marker 5 protein [Methanobacteriaceae archaeon]MDE4077420.1 methanogenesis marker 5 protein [Candidatus Methanosphaera massiliense]
MMKVAIFPPNSMILADMIVRSGHEPLVVQKEMKQKVTSPDIDAPPFNMTEEDPINGLKYAAIEVPSGVRGRMSLFGPIIEQAEAAIIMSEAPYGFGCVGCARSAELTVFSLRRRNIPILELEYPTSRDATVEMVYKINTFLDNLKEEEE